MFSTGSISIGKKLEESFSLFIIYCALSCQERQLTRFSIHRQFLSQNSHKTIEQIS